MRAQTLTCWVRLVPIAALLLAACAHRSPPLARRVEETRTRGLPDAREPLPASTHEEVGAYAGRAWSNFENICTLSRRGSELAVIGHNDKGELGIPPPATTGIVRLPEPAVEVASGSQSWIVRTSDGRVYAPIASADGTYRVVQIPLPGPATQLLRGTPWQGCMVVRSQGVFCVPHDHPGTAVRLRNSPTDVVDITFGPTDCALDAEGVVYCWSSRVAKRFIDDVTMFASASYLNPQLCVVRTGGNMYC